MNKTHSYPGNRYSDPNRGDNKKVAPSMRKTFTVSDMNNRHHEIVRRLVLGQKGSEIAEDMGISYATVANVKASPIAQEQMALIRGARDTATMDVVEQIKDLAPKCVQLLKEQIDGTTENVSEMLKSRNAFGLLSIAGHAPVRNVNVKQVTAVLTGSDIERIREKSIQAGIKTGLVVDD